MNADLLRQQQLLACLANASRLCRENGCDRDDASESFEYGWRTPEPPVSTGKQEADRG